MAPPPENRVAPADILVVGASHKTSNTALRDRLFITPEDEPAVLDALRAGGFDQAVVVSTCDRVEICGIPHDLDTALRTVQLIMETRAGAERLGERALYNMSGRTAVKHLFGVAASLESEVIGEAEVLGQVKEARARAQAHGSLGSELDLLFQKAFSAAKEVRTRTAIAEGPLTLANAALRAVQNLFGTLDKVSALLLGPGEMGGLMLSHFRHHDLKHFVVAGPTPERAASAGRAFGTHFVTYEELPDALVQADLVIGAAGTGRLLITADMMRAAIRARRRKPVFILDVAIPADVDRAVDDLEDVFLYDLDDLEMISRANRDSRDSASREAWDIVERHTDGFFDDVIGRSADPEVADLRAYFEMVRAEVLASAGDTDPDEVTRRLIKRLLHRPTEALRAAAREGNGESAIGDAVRRLFALNEFDQPGAVSKPPKEQDK